jgi:hypothetical protein
VQSSWREGIGRDGSHIWIVAVRDPAADDRLLLDAWPISNLDPARLADVARRAGLEQVDQRSLPRHDTDKGGRSDMLALTFQRPPAHREAAP